MEDRLAWDQWVEGIKGGTQGLINELAAAGIVPVNLLWFHHLSSHPFQESEPLVQHHLIPNPQGQMWSGSWRSKTESSIEYQDFKPYLSILKTVVPLTEKRSLGAAQGQSQQSLCTEAAGPGPTYGMRELISSNCLLASTCKPCTFTHMHKHKYTYTCTYAYTYTPIHT